MSNHIHECAQSIAEAHHLDLSLFSDPLFSGKPVELQLVREPANLIDSPMPLRERIAGSGAEVYKSLNSRLLPVLAIYGVIAEQNKLVLPDDHTKSRQWGITGPSIIRLLSPPRLQTGSLGDFSLTLTDPKDMPQDTRYYDKVLGNPTDYPTIPNTSFAFTLTATYEKRRKLSSAIGLQLRRSPRGNQTYVSGKMDRISQGKAPHLYTYNRVKPQEF